MRPARISGAALSAFALLVCSGLVYGQGTEIGIGDAETAPGYGDTLLHQATAPRYAASDVALVADLYAFEQWLQGLSSAERIRAFRKLSPIAEDCANPRAALKATLLLDGIEPELTNFALARRLLKRCLGRIHGPAATAYVQLRLYALERDQRLHRALEVLTQKLVQAHVENVALNERIKMLEAKLDALADIEQSLQERRQP